jgi:hypothetical protein
LKCRKALQFCRSIKYDSEWTWWGFISRWIVERPFLVFGSQCALRICPAFTWTEAEIVSGPTSLLVRDDTSSLKGEASYPFSVLYNQGLKEAIRRPRQL